MTQAEHRDISHKIRILNHAQESGNVSKTCPYFGVSRETFYQWERAHDRNGERALINSKPCPQNPKLRTPSDSVARIISECKESSTTLIYAVIWKRLLTNFACPVTSLLSNLFTYPFLIMFTASTPCSVRSAVSNER